MPDEDEREPGPKQGPDTGGLTPWRTPGISPSRRPAAPAPRPPAPRPRAWQPPPVQPPPPAPPSPEPRPGRRSPLLLPLVAAVVLGIVVVLVVVLLTGGDDDPAPAVVGPSPTTPSTGGTAPATTGPTGPAESAPPDTAAADPEAAALAELEELRATTLAEAPPQGQWVAQLASKYVGMDVPQETSADGDHVFSAADILAEHRSLAERAGPLRLLRTGDYGKGQTRDGNELWVTYADVGLVSASEVTAWCTPLFPGLSGKALTDVCLPRQINPRRG